MPSIYSISSKKVYHEDTLTKKARTSITNFFPGLKRKRSLYNEEEEEMTVAKKKKMNTMTRLFQKIAMATTNKKKQDIILEYESYKFEFTLPTIECTNGCLGIIKEEESSIFDTKEGIIMEFPIPPLSLTRRCRRRQDSCPARFHSIIISPEESDEEELLTPCLSETNLLIDKIHDLNI